MSVAEVKSQIIEELDFAEEDVLNDVKNILISKHYDIPESVLKSIEISRQEIAEGKGIPHEEVMKMAEEWLKR